MPAIRPVLEEGPITYSANVNISGGQLVMPDGVTGRIKPATAATFLCLGVAIGDAIAFAGASQSSVDAWGNPLYMAQQPPNEVAVAISGVWRLTAQGAIAFGDWVQVGTVAGSVATAGAANIQPIGSPFTVIGRCVDPAGIADTIRGKIMLGGMVGG